MSFHEFKHSKNHIIDEDIILNLYLPLRKCSQNGLSDEDWEEEINENNHEYFDPNCVFCTFQGKIQRKLLFLQVQHSLNGDQKIHLLRKFSLKIIASLQPVMFKSSIYSNNFIHAVEFL